MFKSPAVLSARAVSSVIRLDPSDSSFTIKINNSELITIAFKASCLQLQQKKKQALNIVWSLLGSQVFKQMRYDFPDSLQTTKYIVTKVFYPKIMPTAP